MLIFFCKTDFDPRSVARRLSPFKVARSHCSGRRFIVCRRLFDLIICLIVPRNSRSSDHLFDAGGDAPIKIVDLFGRQAVDVGLIVIEFCACHDIGDFESMSLGLRDQLLEG